MREFRSYGSARGAAGNSRPYRELFDVSTDALPALSGLRNEGYDDDCRFTIGWTPQD